MAKITAEARKHLITRNSVSFRVTVRTFSMKDGKPGELTAEISGDYATDIEMLSAVAGRYTTAETAVVPVAVKPIEKLEDRRAMFDDQFAFYAHPVKEDEKLTGLMVRSLKVTAVHAVSADFVERKFTDETLFVVGTFETAEQALAWYSKRHPEDKKVYGCATIENPVEIKYGMPVSEFYSHSFSITEEQGEA